MHACTLKCICVSFEDPKYLMKAIIMEQLELGKRAHARVGRWVEKALPKALCLRIEKQGDIDGCF